jgi:hypothetical protein
MHLALKIGKTRPEKDLCSYSFHCLIKSFVFIADMKILCKNHSILAQLESGHNLVFRPIRYPFHALARLSNLWIYDNINRIN